MRRRLGYILLLAGLAFWSGDALSLSLMAANNTQLKQLKKQKNKVDQRVRSIDRNLSRNRRSTRQTIQEVERLNRTIESRNRLIRQQSQDIADLAAHIDQLNADILRMEMDYNVAKRKYVQLIYLAYQKNTVYDRLLFIFSARTVQQSYLRLRYLRQFAVMRRRQANEIQTSRQDLLAKRKELQTAKDESERLLAARESEKKKLEEEKVQQKALVASLRQQRKSLRAELNRQQRASDNLDRRIQDLIAQEARAAARRAQQIREEHRRNSRKASAPQSRKQGKRAPSAKTRQDSPSKLDREQAQYTADCNNFAKQRGSLHWPVRQGSIAGHFGLQAHPYLENVTTDNKGVYIATPVGSDAISVFEGQVTQVFSIPGSNSAVIVRHGNFLTVYANLTNLYVKRFQMVKRGQKLGRVYSDPDDPGQSTLFFQIWKEKTLQNPERWLRPIN